MFHQVLHTNTLTHILDALSKHTSPQTHGGGLNSTLCWPAPIVSKRCFQMPGQHLSRPPPVQCFPGFAFTSSCCVCSQETRTLEHVSGSPYAFKKRWSVLHPRAGPRTRCQDSYSFPALRGVQEAPRLLLLEVGTRRKQKKGISQSPFPLMLVNPLEPQGLQLTSSSWPQRVAAACSRHPRSYHPGQ